MWVSLRSRMTIVGDMTAGLYEVIHEDGLSMPAQRVLAEKCRISGATLSRRLQRWGWEDLVVGLVDARGRTFPAALRPTTWAEWLPGDEDELADACVWAACEQVAVGSQRVATAVAAVWGEQRRTMAQLLPQTNPDDAMVDEVADALHAIVMGLTARTLIDCDFDHDRALAVLTTVVDAVATRPRAT